MTLKELLTEQLSGELKRVRDLFVKGFKTFLGGKSREKRLDFMEAVVDETMNKAEMKLFIIQLQKNFNKKKKK